MLERLTEDDVFPKVVGAAHVYPCFSNLLDPSSATFVNALALGPVVAIVIPWHCSGLRELLADDVEAGHHLVCEPPVTKHELRPFRVDIGSQRC